MPKYIERKTLASSLLKYKPQDFQIAFESNPVAIVVVDQYSQSPTGENYKTYQANPAAFKLFRARKPAVLFGTLPVLLEHWQKRNELDLTPKSIGRDQQIKLATLTGVRRDVVIKTACLKSSPQMVRWLLTFQDISGRCRLEKRLRQMAQCDGLTGLFNQRTMIQRLEYEVARASRYNLPLSCLLFDLDNFKTINDQYGHLVGDRVIKKFAAILKDGFRETDIVGRFGGDEFLAILTETPGESAQIPALRIKEFLASSGYLLVSGKKIPLSFSVGTGVFSSNNALDADALIVMADKAMHRTKKSSR